MVSVAFKTSGITRTIVIDILTGSFDRIEDTTGLLYKINFYCVYGKMFFLFESFLNSRRL